MTERTYSNWEAYLDFLGNYSKPQFLEGVEYTNQRLVQKPYLVVERVHESDFEGTWDFYRVNDSFAELNAAVDYVKECNKRLHAHYSVNSWFETEEPEFSEVMLPNAEDEHQVAAMFRSFFYQRFTPRSTDYRQYRFLVLRIPFDPLIGFPLFEFMGFDRDFEYYFTSQFRSDPNDFFALKSGYSY